MEFPSLGGRCAVAACQQLDFLPFKCSGCGQVYCLDHRTFATHNCASPTRDVQLLVCPLCSQPVPGKPEDDPNIRMDEHIAHGCRTSGGNGKSTRNKCSAKNCGTKLLMPIVCAKCKLEFCVKHRMEPDHACAGVRAGTLRLANNTASSAAATKPATARPASFAGQGTAKAPTPAAAAMPKQAPTPAAARASSAPLPANVEQEDEMLARALQLSIDEQLAERQEQLRRQGAAGQQRPATQQQPAPRQQQQVDLCTLM